MPCVSPNTWISMWRGRTRYFSISTRSSPKLDSGFALARGERGGEVGGLVDDAHALAAAAGLALISTG